MRSNSTRCRRVEPGEPGFAISQSDSNLESGTNANSAEEIVGEIGLVLVVILGAIVAINMLLAALYLGQ